MKIHKILETLTFPVGILITLGVMTTLSDGLGFTRMGTFGIAILAFVGIAILASPGLRRYDMNTKLASLVLGAAVMLGFMTFSMPPLSGFASTRAWGEWGPYLGYICDQPKSQMVAECILTGMVTMVLCLGIWMGYGLWQDHRRPRQAVAQ